MSISASNGGKRRAVFLDRDGTINVEKSYLYRVEDFEFLPGVPQAIQRLNQLGLTAVVVTNQAGIARGYFQADDVAALHRFIDRELSRYAARIDGYYFCPHHPTEGKGALRQKCRCRKPGIGMLDQAASELGLQLSDSFLVGDKMSDIEAAINAGCQPILVRTGYGGEIEAADLPSGVWIARDLTEAVGLIEKEV